MDLIRAGLANDGGYHLPLWKPDASIRVGFFDGSQALQDAVARTANEWTNEAGLKLLFGSDIKTAEIRISFFEDVSWSYLGVEALVAAKDQPTMALGQAASAFKSNDLKTFHKLVLTEFGHALGLISEHQNPKAELHFNRDFYMKNYSWNSSTFDRNFKPYSDLKNYREFDPDSVMMFNFGAESLSDGKAITGGDNLSPSDLALIRRLYPKSN